MDENIQTEKITIEGNYKEPKLMEIWSTFTDARLSIVMILIIILIVEDNNILILASEGTRMLIFSLILIRTPAHLN